MKAAEDQAGIKMHFLVKQKAEDGQAQARELLQALQPDGSPAVIGHLPKASHLSLTAFVFICCTETCDRLPRYMAICIHTTIILLVVRMSMLRPSLGISMHSLCFGSQARDAMCCPVWIEHSQRLQPVRAVHECCALQCPCCCWQRHCF